MNYEDKYINGYTPPFQIEEIPSTVKFFDISHSSAKDSYLRNKQLLEKQHSVNCVETHRAVEKELQHTEVIKKKDFKKLYETLKKCEIKRRSQYFKDFLSAIETELGTDSKKFQEVSKCGTLQKSFLFFCMERLCPVCSAYTKKKTVRNIICLFENYYRDYLLEEHALITSNLFIEAMYKIKNISIYRDIDFNNLESEFIKLKQDFKKLLRRKEFKTYIGNYYIQYSTVNYKNKFQLTLSIIHNGNFWKKQDLLRLWNKISNKQDTISINLLENQTSRNLDQKIKEISFERSFIYKTKNEYEKENLFYLENTLCEKLSLLNNEARNLLRKYVAYACFNFIFKKSSTKYESAQQYEIVNRVFKGKHLVGKR